MQPELDTIKRPSSDSGKANEGGVDGHFASQGNIISITLNRWNEGCL